MTNPAPYPALMRGLLAAVLGFGAMTTGFAAEAATWISLFDGRTLTGWKRVGGHARYEVREGAIVGTVVADKFSSFLVTEAEFGDFEFECQFKADWGPNSGVQFRASLPSGYPETRMQGYQYEIDPTDRGITGALNVDVIGRKGHGLSPSAHKGPPRDEWVKLRGNGKWFLPDQWNTLRIVCRGTRIKLWLNDKLTVEVDDATAARGFIGLQVPFAPDNSPLIGKEFAFRHLRLRRLN